MAGDHEGPVLAGFGPLALVMVPPHRTHCCPSHRLKLDGDV